MQDPESQNIHFMRGYNPASARAGMHLGMAAWGPAQAQHLLNRAAFGGTVAEVQAASALSREEMIGTLLAAQPLPEPPGAWINDPYVLRGLSEAERKKRRQANREHLIELLVWWITQMSTASAALREKMVVFWHGHFATEVEIVKVAQLVYRHNAMLRRNALGNFRTFLKEMWRDPAMLVYLNGVQNQKNSPNENFARELLELFTMGVDNYTEQDIKEAARAFTGWRIDLATHTASLNPNRFDAGSKTFLGRTGNFSGDDIIDIILEQPVTADFICAKLHRFFVNFEPDAARIAALATIFRNNNYEIKPVLHAIFSSDYFYAAENIGALIKSPVQLVMSTPRHFNAGAADARYLYNAAALLDQALGNPPNVAGWKGQRAWISPLLLATRAAFGETVIQGGRIDRNAQNRNVKAVQVDSMAFARSFGIGTPRELLQRWIEHLLPIALDALTQESLLSILLEGAAEQDWSLDYPGVEDRVKNCLTQLLRLPEYQLF